MQVISGKTKLNAPANCSGRERRLPEEGEFHVIDRLTRTIGLVILLALVTLGASGGVISGIVRDPSGAPLKGVFVQARSMAIKNLTVSVLTDGQGRYRIENLTPGDYMIRAKANDYESD